MDSDLEPDVRNEASNEIRDQYLDASQGARAAGLVAGVHVRRQACGATVDWYTDGRTSAIRG